MDSVIRQLARLMRPVSKSNFNFNCPPNVGLPLSANQLRHGSETFSQPIHLNLKS